MMSEAEALTRLYIVLLFTLPVMATSLIVIAGALVSLAMNQK